LTGGSDGDALRVIQTGEAVALGAPDLRTRCGRPGRAPHTNLQRAIGSMGPSTEPDARSARVRELARAGVPWPAIAAEVGLSATRARQLCADLTPRKGGRPSTYQAPRHEHDCPICGHRFMAVRTAVYCSTRCRVAAVRARQRR